MEKFSEADVARRVEQDGIQEYTRTKTQMIQIRGAIVCGVKLNSASSTSDNWFKQIDIVNAYTKQHGSSPLVFISCELFWKCYNKEGLTYRQFSTMCAINSVIGFKSSPVLIRRCMIIARQLGYKSPVELRGEIARGVALKPLTTQQLRDTLDWLESKELIARCQASFRDVYFSNGKDKDQFRADVKALVEKRNAIRTKRETDRGVMMGTDQEPQKNHLKRNLEKGAEKEPLKKEEPIENHSGTTEGTTTGTTTGTTKINDPKEMVLNKCVQSNDESVAPNFADRFADWAKSFRADES